MFQKIKSSPSSRYLRDKAAGFLTIARGRFKTREMNLIDGKAGKGKKSSQPDVAQTDCSLGHIHANDAKIPSYRDNVVMGKGTEQGKM